MDTKLTSKEYWEEYYKKTQTSKVKISRIVSEYDQLWEILLSQNEANPPKTILEIGGYPGRYLAYLSDKFSLVPTCLDYNSDVSKIEECMKIFDVNDYKVLQTDIFNHQIEKQYDIVISLGFVEHFSDYNQILDKHCEYLKPGGTLLIMIPNKRWLRKWYGYIVDYDNLKAHNLKCMNFKTFNDFAKRNNLKEIKLTYFGEFQYAVHQKLNFIQDIIKRVVKFIFKRLNPFLRNHPSKFYSSSIIAIYKK